MTYFDWAATGVVDENILQEAMHILIEYGANPSSIHDAGIAAKHKLEEARQRCAKALGVSAQTIIFTSGGTESNCLPIISLLQRQAKGSILINATEHATVREQAYAMERCGWNVIQIPCDNRGIVQPDSVVRLLQDDTALVCVMAVNNETGAVQPIYDISDCISTHCKGKKRAKFHVDAVQAVGKIPLTLDYSGIDTVALSAHKLYAPGGIGILYMKERQEPFLRGGGQENGLRSGTENIFGAWAFSRCLEKYAEKDTVAKELHRQEEKLGFFLEKLQSISACSVIPSSRTTATDKNFSPWIVQASFKDIPGEVMVRALSEKGFYISTGSACASRKNARPVLDAMDIDKNTARNAVRFSFSPSVSQDDIEALFSAVSEVCARFQ